MGGSQQAQGHAQVLVDMIDLGANPQAASDAARFTHAQATNTLDLESSLYELVGAQLAAMGHKVSQPTARTWAASSRSGSCQRRLELPPRHRHRRAARNNP